MPPPPRKPEDMLQFVALLAKQVMGHIKEKGGFSEGTSREHEVWVPHEKNPNVRIAKKVTLPQLIANLSAEITELTGAVDEMTEMLEGLEVREEGRRKSKRSNKIRARKTKP